MAPHHSNVARFTGWHTLSRGQIAGLCFVLLWFFIGGIAHFVATDAEMRIVPPYIPWPRATVCISGAFELLGAAGVLWSRTRRVAGTGLFVLTVAVTPANVYMLQHAVQFGIPAWILVARLPLQAVLLAVIVYSAIIPGRVASTDRHQQQGT